MKDWQDLFKEKPSSEHDKKVYQSALTLLKEKQNKSQIHWFAFWSTLTPLKQSLAVLGLAGLITLISWQVWNTQTLNLDLQSFQQQYSELAQHPEDLELLSEDDLELLENIDLIENLEDV